LIECLIEHGIHILAPGSLTISERVNLFRHADVVIGPHSDDLADVMFCKPGALLWELMPRHYQNPCNNRLAQAVGLDYWADLFEPISKDNPKDWSVDLHMVTARLRRIAERLATARSVMPPKAIPLVSLMTQFESLGDNCEFGLVQRQAGSEPLGLLRFAGFQVPPEGRLDRLVDALDRKFEGLGEEGAINISAEGSKREFIIKEAAYGLHYHTFRHEREVEIEAIRKSEPRRLGFLRRKFLDDIASGAKILVWQSPATRTVGQVMPLLKALRRHGPNVLLWVVEADASHPPGTVERHGPDLLKGYVARFAPADNATDVDAESWFEVCHCAYDLYRDRLSLLDEKSVEHQECTKADSIPTPAARNILAAGLRSWLRGTVQSHTTPEDLRSKGCHFLGEASKADASEVSNQLHALAYIHFEVADDVATVNLAP
jgi:hypothetical protein